MKENHPTSESPNSKKYYGGELMDTHATAKGKADVGHPKQDALPTPKRWPLPNNESLSEGRWLDLD